MSGDLPHPEIEPSSHTSHALWQAGSLSLAPSGKPNLLSLLCSILFPQSLLKVGFALEESFGHLELRVHGAHTTPALLLLLGTWSLQSSSDWPWEHFQEYLWSFGGALQLSEDLLVLLLTPCEIFHCWSLIPTYSNLRVCENTQPPGLLLSFGFPTLFFCFYGKL